MQNKRRGLFLFYFILIIIVFITFIFIYLQKENVLLQPSSCGNLVCESEEDAQSCAIDCNLVENAGFEDGSNTNGVPLLWENKWSVGGGLKELDSTEKHSGLYSWRFDHPSNTGYQGAYSNFISVEFEKYYRLSAWIKSLTGEENVYLGWEEFDENFVSLGNSFVRYFVLQRSKISTEWTEFSGVWQVQNFRTKYIRIRFFGPYESIGSVWWDDFSFERLDVFLPESGCINNEDSKCLDFGADEGTAGAEFSLNLMSETESEGEISFRRLLPKKILEVSFPAFNINEEGFPLTPMLLEIKYKDVIDRRVASGTTSHRALVFSKINFLCDDPLCTSMTDKTFYPIGYLGEYNDNVWKNMQYVFQESDWQLLRSLNGKFIIRINMPGIFPEDDSLNLPIDYISIKSISEEEALKFAESERIIRGFVRAEIPLDNPPNDLDYSNSDLVIFVKDLMEPVYLDSKPKLEEVSNIVEGFSSLGEIEPLSFSIYSESGLDNLNFEISELKNINSEERISKESIKIYQIVNDERKTTPYFNKQFALIPDRLEEAKEIIIPPEKSQRIWLKVNVPENLAGGIYTGEVKIKQEENQIGSVEIKLRVIPILLDDSRNINPVYHDPFTKTFSNNLDETFRVFRETGLDVFIHSMTASTYSPVIQNGEIIDFDFSVFETRIDRMISEGVINKKALIETEPIWGRVYSIVHRASVSSSDINLYQKLSEQRFVDDFGLAIRKLNEIAQRKGFEFYYSVNDEPTNNPYKRVVADRIFPIIKSNNGITTATYHTTCESPLNVNGIYNIPELGNVLPPLIDLVDFKVWNSASQDEGYMREYNNYGYYTTRISYLRNPIYNRFLHGLLAFRTTASIVSSYAFGDLIGDPYNDFDARVNYVYPFTYPDFVLAYPTWRDILVETMALEGIREGIKDAKYISTLNRLIEEKGSLEETEAARNYLELLKDRISPNFWNDYVLNSKDYGFYEPILKDVSNSGDMNDFSSFSKIRADIMNYIIMIGFEECNYNSICDSGENFELCSSDCVANEVANNNQISNSGGASNSEDENNDNDLEVRNRSINRSVEQNIDYLDTIRLNYLVNEFRIINRSDFIVEINGNEYTGSFIVLEDKVEINLLGMQYIISIGESVSIRLEDKELYLSLDELTNGNAKIDFELREAIEKDSRTSPFFVLVLLVILIFIVVIIIFIYWRWFL